MTLSRRRDYEIFGAKMKDLLVSLKPICAPLLPLRGLPLVRRLWISKQHWFACVRARVCTERVFVVCAKSLSPSQVLSECSTETLAAGGKSRAQAWLAGAHRLASCSAYALRGSLVCAQLGP